MPMFARLRPRVVLKPFSSFVRVMARKARQARL